MKPYRTKIAKLTQKYIEVHYRETIKLEDLCLEMGIGTRKLQRCFKETFSLTITDYIKSTRLNAVNQELAESDSPHDAIATIALNHGFNHLGRFSTVYRKHFGETPSETLAK